METTYLSNLAKTKAISLVKKFYVDAIIPFEASKNCALILVNEILEEIDWHITDVPHNEISYWQEVKQEIQKL
jgi:hypothetical protein